MGTVPTTDFLIVKHNYSIGMVYFNAELIMQTVLLESLNVQLFLEIHSCMISLSQTRQEHFGTIHIIVSSFSSSCQVRLKSVSRTETQYCDGLRGPLIIYDPNDPFKSQYVVTFDLDRRLSLTVCAV